MSCCQFEDAKINATPEVGEVLLQKAAGVEPYRVLVYLDKVQPVF